MNKDTLILASSSPRRKGLLSKITDNFIIQSPTGEEKSEGTPTEVVTSNALSKGRSIKGNFVLACDTVVAYKNTIYGKPHDYEDACNTLKFLSNKTHSVYTGVYVRHDEEETVFFDESSVTFKKLSDEDVIYYVDNYNPLDKAGSYGIQDGIIIAGYEGSYDNIMGLPTEKLREILKRYIYVKEERND